MRKGWVKLPRNFQDAPSFDHASDVAVFVHCLLRANLSATVYKGIQLEAGEFLTSVDQLSRECGLTEKQVRWSLIRLEKGGQLGTKRASKGAKKGTIITVVNYGDSDGSWSGKGEEKGEKEGEEQGKSKRMDTLDTSVEDKVVQGLTSDKSDVCETGVSRSVIKRLVDIWERCHLAYLDHGEGGSLEGMIGRLLTEGDPPYTEEQIERGIWRLASAVTEHRIYRKPIKDHAAFLVGGIMPTIGMEDDQPGS